MPSFSGVTTRLFLGGNSSIICFASPLKNCPSLCVAYPSASNNSPHSTPSPVISAPALALRTLAGRLEKVLRSLKRTPGFCCCCWVLARAVVVVAGSSGMANAVTVVTGLGALEDAADPDALDIVAY